MKRRDFIRSVGSAIGAAAIPTVSARTLASPRPPRIAQSELDIHGWEEADDEPKLPPVIREDHPEDVDKTTFRLNSFHGAELPAEIESETPLSDVQPLKHIWAARVTTADANTEAVWNEGESAEAAASIDGTAEAAFEQYMQESILEGDIEFRGEWHRKAVEEGTGGLLGSLPGPLGTTLETAFSWKWNLTTSVTTETGNTSHISEYYFSLPLTSVSADAEEQVETETALDFRGLYIDWFAEGNVFYAAGGIYPESENRLNEQLTDGFDSGILDFNPPEFDISTDGAYEQEMIELLKEVE